jgi:hypothetical protein
MVLITAARDSFSTESQICDSCGHQLFADWNAKQLRDQLNGALTRVARVLERASPEKERIVDDD